MVAETQVNSVTDFGALASLKARAAGNDPAAIRDAARQFEALFLQMMLKSMRDAGSVFAEPRDRTYEEMFDRQIALELSQSESLGIADVLLRQIDSHHSRDLSPPTQGNEPALTVASGRSSRARSDFRPADAGEFIDTIWPLAEAAGERLGVDPRGIAAQAVLETGWGGQLVRDSRGVSGNNLFGIKADERWGGERISVATLEFEGAQFVPRQAQFRAYPTLAEGFAGYQQFLASEPRYAEALSRGADPREFAQELQEAGYATDPGYAGKIDRILSSQRFLNLVNAAATKP